MADRTTSPSPWLVLDIGNSATKGAFMIGEQVQSPFLIPGDRGLEAWSKTLRDHLTGTALPERVGIATVVPALGRLATETVNAMGLAEPLIVRPSLQLPIELGYQTPDTLGMDRLALAVGAWAQYGQSHEGRPRPVIAIDAGTALTYEVITAKGVYAGGVIAPGPRLMAWALHHGTAQLPDIPLTPPPSLIGQDTISAIQSGVIHGFLDGVRGMLERLQAALDTAPVIVVTGGWSSLLREHLADIHAADAHLVLRGIRTLMALNS